MRLGEGVEWGLHCATVLALLPPEASIPAARLAEFHGIPAAYLAKILQSLSSAGVIEAVPGRRGGYRLARPAADITLLDVVLAVDGEEPAFRCTEIRRRGPAAVPARKYSPACAIAGAMWQAEEAFRSSLRSTTIGDLVRQLAGTVPPEAAAKAAAWFQEALP